MTGLAILFMVVTVGALLGVRREWAPLPLLFGTCYITLSQVILIGPFHFTVIRVLIFAGFIRVLTRRESLPGGLIKLDRIFICWGAWFIFSSAFHNSPREVLITNLGIVYNAFGIYFLTRIFCRSLDDVSRLAKMTAILFAPIALEMVNEVVTENNLFSVFGGIRPKVRDDKLRAQGPFDHSILAGTVAAVSIPLVVALWRGHPTTAKVGVVSCVLMVATCNSSGPIMSAVFALFAISLWRWRHLTRQMRIASVVCYFILELIMKDPAYFIMGRIDLTGSSSGWHRAEVIRSAFQHLDEWWFAGTDYTRHWMATGVSFSEDHCDITNHFLYYGVSGGLPLMLLFLFALVVVFSYAGKVMRMFRNRNPSQEWIVWCLGCSLFAHTATFLSVAYYDQSFAFIFLHIAAMGSLSTLQSSSSVPYSSSQ